MGKKLTTEEFINKAILIHGIKYDYSLVDYINTRSKVKIICLEHGEFEQNPNNHLNGKGCSRCAGKCRSLTTDMVIGDFNKVHNNKYDYSMVNYIDNLTKISIVCPIHGVFEQTPAAHKQKQGCPLCNASKGEDTIKTFLIEHSINFTQQYRFSDCKLIKPLPFDFYLPEHNICIEFNGKQHYEPIKYWGGEDDFKLRQKRDKIKMEYCHKNNIPLIIIKYDDNDVVLESKLNRVAIIG